MYRKGILKTVRTIQFFLVLVIMFQSRVYSQVSEPYLERIVVNYDSVVIPKKNKPLVFSNRFKDIVFSTGGGKEGTLVSFTLEGYDVRWTPYSSTHIKEYTNLPRGNYKLKIKWEEPSGESGELDLINFRIEPPFYQSSFFFIIYGVLALILAWLFYRQIIHRHKREQDRLEEIITERTEELMVEKGKTESLLANVLPKGTADEIMSKGKATKQKFNFVTVLFSDIQGFTKIAEEVNPEVLIDELDKFFFYFDSVVERLNIEKIKTIGDAYMCAGGLPESNRTNPIEVVLAAIEMQQFMENLKSEQRSKGMKYWDIRIGIHTGTVIAGVVGQKKLSYDIWGDTVNTASRMESSGEAGKVNISGVTYEYVKEFFICEYRGKMPVKYKGELDMYFVNGIRPEFRETGRSGPNRQFFLRLQLIRLSDIEDRVFEEYAGKESEKLIFHDHKYLRNIATQAELIGRAEMINDERMIILRLASVFIFAGLADNYEKFLDASLVLLERIADDHGFSEEQMNEARQVIIDGLGENPQTKEGKILNDAVFDYFGRIDFLKKSELLYKEETGMGSDIDKKRWFGKHADLIRNHEFRTDTAKLLRSVSCDQQVELINEYIAEL